MSPKLRAYVERPQVVQDLTPRPGPSIQDHHAIQTVEVHLSLITRRRTNRATHIGPAICVGVIQPSVIQLALIVTSSWFITAPTKEHKAVACAVIDKLIWKLSSCRWRRRQPRRNGTRIRLRRKVKPVDIIQEITAAKENNSGTVSGKAGAATRWRDKACVSPVGGCQLVVASGSKAVRPCAAAKVSEKVIRYAGRN